MSPLARGISILKDAFPDAFVDGRIDFDVLRELLCEAADDYRRERYCLAWNGKTRARRIAEAPPAGELRPCPEESVDWDTTQNLLIEGDNLEVLKLLQRQSGEDQDDLHRSAANTGNDLYTATTSATARRTTSS